MSISTKYRTEETEIMDDFSLQGEELREALDKIASINQLLGGNNITLNGVKQLLEKADVSKPVVIADIGCGNGDMLRMLSAYASKNSINLKMIGVDANSFTVSYARMLSSDYPDIEYVCTDIFSKDFSTLKYDIVLCTLTLHHFTNEQIINIITTFNKNSTMGIIVNDLHRSRLAYRLFKIICFLFGLNRMSSQDGLVSILRGFKKNELEDFSSTLKLKNYTIQWKWAFRYQWIIAKI